MSSLQRKNDVLLEVFGQLHRMADDDLSKQTPLSLRTSGAWDLRTIKGTCVC
jgi:hypothetical protein